MAVDVSYLPIINRALTLLGTNRITSTQLATPDNKASRAAFEEFNDHLDALIEDHPWKLFKQRATLTPEGAAPEWEFAYSYVLPDGVLPALKPYCLRVLKINEDLIWDWSLGSGWSSVTTTEARWRVENRRIVTDLGDELAILYLGRPSSAAYMTGQFRELLAHYLAVSWHVSLAGSESKLDRIEARFYRMLNEFRTIDSQQDQIDPFQTTSWLSSRL